MALVEAVLMAGDSVAGGFDPSALLTGIGIPAAVLALFVTGKLRPESEVKRLERENNRLNKVVETKDALIASMNDALVQKAIPALTRSTQVLESLKSPPGEEHR
jgi:hypothetical protein